MACIPSHGSVKDFDKALSEICNGVEDRKNEERPILEAFLRRQCCRMLDEQLAWTHRKASERLLKKVNFYDWKSTKNVRESQILRRYQIEDREDYTKYQKVAKLIMMLCARLRKLKSSDEDRIKMTEILLDKLYSLVVIVRMKFADGLSKAISYIKQGEIRIGPDVVTNPALHITRDMEDLRDLGLAFDHITWAEGSKMRRHIKEFANEETQVLQLLLLLLFPLHRIPLRSAAVKQERQLMSAQRAFYLKEQQCSARLEALRDRCQVQQLRAVHSLVASLDQAQLGHLMHTVFLHWAVAMQASRQKEASVKKPKAAREAACASPSKTINLQQALQLPTPQRRKQNQRDASTPRTKAESSSADPPATAAKDSATTAVADENTRLEVSKPTLTCTSGGSTSWQPTLACRTSRTICTGLTRSTSGSLCLAPGAPNIRAASVRPAFRLASPSPLRLARTKAPATSWASSGSVTPIAPIAASSAGTVSATSRTIRSISTTVRRAPSTTVSPVVVWAHPNVSSRPRVLRQVEIGLPGKTKPYAFVQRVQGERPACAPCRMISYAQKFGN
eukprot:s1873_g2.t2